MSLKLFAKNKQFFTDGKDIYYQNYGMQQPKPIPGVDPSTFVVHSHYLASDRNNVYVISTMREGLQIFHPEDFDSLIFFPAEISANMFVDKHNLYTYCLHYVQYSDTSNEKQQKLLDWLKTNHPNTDGWWNHPKNLHQTPQTKHGEFFSSKNKVFYRFKTKEFYDDPAYEYAPYRDYYLQLTNVDEDSFQALNNVYAKDKKQVYFYSRQISADTASFQVITTLFAKDKSGIWYNGRLVSGVDVDTFVVIQGDPEHEFQFAKDKHTVYANALVKIDQYSGYAHLLLPLKNSRPQSFTIINETWAKDSNNVYWHGKVYKKADAASFKIIAKPPLTTMTYASDSNYVYTDNSQTIKSGLHGGSFRILNKYWAKDDFVVYSLLTQKIQKNIDVASFTLTPDPHTAEDKNYYYKIATTKITKVKK